MPRLELRARTDLDGSGFAAGTRKMETVARQAAGRIGGAFKSRLAAAFGTAALAAATKQVIDFGSEIFDLSKRTGVSTSTLQQLDFVAKQTGTDLLQFVKVIQRLAQRQVEAQQGNARYRQSIEALGLSWDEFRAARPEELLFKILTNIKGAGEEGEAFGNFVKLFGEESAAIFGSAQQDVDALRQSFKDLNSELSADTIANLKRIGDEMTNLKAQAAPTLATMAEGFGYILKLVNGIAGGVGAVAQTTGRAFATLTTPGGARAVAGLPGPLVRTAADTLGAEEAARRKAVFDEAKERMRIAAEIEKQAAAAELAAAEAKGRAFIDGLFQKGIDFVRKYPAALEAAREVVKADQEAKDEAERLRGFQSNVNELQRVGAFAVNPQDEAANMLRRQSVDVLREIRKRLVMINQAVKDSGVL